MSNVNGSSLETAPATNTKSLDWRELVLAGWVLGVFAAFLRQMLSAFGS